MNQSISIDRGLIIRPEPLERILSGRKTWEMRSSRINKFGLIALIQKGTQQALGLATITGWIGPLTRDDMATNVDKHGIELGRIDLPDVAKYKYGWILADVKRLKRPVAVPRKNGQVIFVSIPPETAALIAASL